MSHALLIPNSHLGHQKRLYKVFSAGLIRALMTSQPDQLVFPLQEGQQVVYMLTALSGRHPQLSSMRLLDLQLSNHAGSPRILFSPGFLRGQRYGRPCSL